MALMTAKKLYGIIVANRHNEEERKKVEKFEPLIDKVLKELSDGCSLQADITELLKSGTTKDKDIMIKMIEDLGYIVTGDENSYCLTVPETKEEQGSP